MWSAPAWPPHSEQNARTPPTLGRTTGRPPVGGHGPRRLLPRKSCFVRHARVRPMATNAAGRARPPEAPSSVPCVGRTRAFCYGREARCRAAGATLIVALLAVPQAEETRTQYCVAPVTGAVISVGELRPTGFVKSSSGP